jgi:hypothetical protein
MVMLSMAAKENELPHSPIQKNNKDLTEPTNFPVFHHEQTRYIFHL